MKPLVLSVSEAPNLLMIFYGHNKVIILAGAICKLIDWHLYKSLFVCIEVMGRQSGSDQTFQMANIFVLHQEMQRQSWSKALKQTVI